MISKIFSSAREYKKEIILTPLMVTLEVIMEVTLPYLMSELIDKGIYAKSLDMMYKIGGKLLIIAALGLVFGTLAGVFASIASSGFAKNLRHDLYYKVQEFSFANIDKFSTSGIVTRLTTDVSNIQLALQMIIRNAIRAPLMLITSLIMAYHINKKISLVFLLLVPVLGGLLFILSRLAHPYFEKVFTKYDDLNKIVEENIGGIRTVKSFALEDEERGKFNHKSKEIYKYYTKAEKILAFNSPLLEAAMYTSMIMIAFIGARIIVLSNMTELTTGELSGLITYSIQILSSVMILTMISVMVTMSISSMKRIYEIFIEEPSIKDGKNPVKGIKDGSIEFKHVYQNYNNKKRKHVLTDINLKIKSGEKIGIIGATGSGKSSLINLIPRLYDVSDGEVLVGGVDVRDYDLSDLRENIGLVPQKSVLFSGTIASNLRWGKKDATLDELKEASHIACADEFIETLPDKYDTKIDQGGFNVSGGQRQRIAIARALLKKPKILLMDDSLSAVDTKTDKKIRMNLNKYLPDTTKIIIAERLSSVMACDRIIMVKSGKIDDVGTHEELLSRNKLYRQIYEDQEDKDED